MEADDVAAALCQTAGDLLSIVVLREVGAAIEVYTPELGQGAVLKAHIVAIGLAEAMLAGGLLVLEDEGNIHRHHVGICGHGNVV